MKAPTGSGKSTRVPRHLLEAGIRGRIWVIQPRRLAARSVARWVAKQLGEELGGRIGYHVRFDRTESERTEVLFLTPGVALRIASSSQGFSGVSAILLDEFHERSAETDALAALALASGRQGPLVWLLSATVDPEELRTWLSSGSRPVQVLESQGRMYPVQIEYRPMPGNLQLADSMANAVRERLRQGVDGDLLCFVPGVGEIRRTIELLSRTPLPTPLRTRLLSLHGDMEPSEQDAALAEAPPGCVNIVVATNVAETSLTLPGVRHVLDSGYVRSARFDPRRGLDTLYTIRASRRSADQRAGRAGRVAAGTCWRLWSESDIPPQDELPEILRIDLASLWLTLAAFERSPGNFPWPTPPSEERIRSACGLLTMLGALSPSGDVTDLGKRMSRMPVSPRTARVLLEARRLGGSPQALRWAAAWESQGPRDEDLLRRSLEEFVRGAPGREVPLGRLLLSAFADRLAVQASPDRWRLNDGRVCEGSVGGETQLCLALEVQETANAQRGTSLRLREAEPVETSWVEDAFPGRIRTSVEVDWDPRNRRVHAREVVRLADQSLWSRPVDDNRIPRLQAEQLLSSKIAQGEIRWKWGEEEDLWVLRSRLVAKAFPERGLCTFEEEDLELAQAGIVEGCLAAAGVENREVLPYLKEVQGHEQVQFVEKMAPLGIGLASGRKARVAYQTDGSALVSARIGDFIGVKQESVRIGQGRIPMVFEILAPNHRPVQRTSDLDGFWQRSYPQIKADLKRRYPKHPWP
ncbi:MAG TPA: ATP-dependent helicase C-terminal domain-containing protein [Fibrobacteria bacterium]|nr:ATP-dependent helicase C-terminal domain-containing protein [Fibrobacteria bacterium]